EGEVVKIADGVAYINHDLDDSLRAGLIAEADVPPVVLEALGPSHSARINTLVCDIIARSRTDAAPARIEMSSTVRDAANALRRFLFDRVYTPLNRRDDTLRAQNVIRELSAYFLANPDRLPIEYRSPNRSDPPERQVADYVASMTDRFAVEQFERLFVPRFWSV
ncbi:MAG TPA: deoxyguanosinetriphosphate triphosphohydrolase, partial [Thermomicrobiales bacterium]|nr:deoxyguanosinetriphosphate triphosphohydrolase [Thermomicrobiales bacterium]